MPGTITTLPILSAILCSFVYCGSSAVLRKKMSKGLFAVDLVKAHN